MSRMARVRHATEADWPAIAALLAASALPAAGAREHLDDFLVTTRGGQLVATACVETYGTAGLLRSVAVVSDERGTGLGEDIVRRVLDEAHGRGVRTVVLLTTTAAPFFERFGFLRTVREDTPSAVRASAEFQGVCPASATVMTLALDAPAVLVRRATRDDAEAIATIYNEGIADRATLETEPRSADDRATWLSQRGPRHPVCVAVRRDAVIGWIALAPFSMRPAYRFVADLSVYVGRDARGQGIGTRLLETMLVRARALQYHKVVLTTLPTLQPALALYTKFGFRHVGDYREQGWLDGRWVDTRLMERLLD